MDKPVVIYAYNTARQKKGTIDLYNMDEYQKPYTEQNKQETQRSIVCDSTYTKL